MEPNRTDTSGGMESLDLSIIVVNWNGGDLLCRCLASVYGHTSGLAFEVVVVDNASGDGSAERVEKDFPHSVVIRNPSNRGFARAANQGIRACRGERILLLNSDIEVRDNAIREMALFLDRHPGAGMAGCRLVHEDGSCQKSWGRTRSVVNETGERIVQFGLRKRIPLFCRMATRRTRGPRPVDWVSGAFLLTRRSVVERIGFLDERFFLYFEDIDWCARAREAGWQVIYHPHLQAVHTGGGSVAGTESRECLAYRRSQLLFYRKRYGNGANTRVLRLYLGLVALAGIIRAGTAGRFGPRPGAGGAADGSNPHRELLRLVLNR